ncbi:endo-1,4-beta-xylanase [Acetivibrio straminisolvens]|jgi:GH35 family endo-1,4-beta-xylanase/enterochelin esterase-like enzyme|uniref:endo-1,4-beta-xylanase n=1 Tax=Acetivibrio straminisolvens TaxID=253314 RepID=UPI00223EC324|nr:endo-1,4-beta-xylanase [Acetivibrio straminisolvens]
MKIKRFLAKMTALVVLIGVFSVLPLNIGKIYADFEVVYDDFEINYDGWCNIGVDTVLTAVENQGNNDTRGMMVSNRSSKDDGAYSQKGFYVDGGKEYNYSVFVKHSGTGIENFKLSLSYLDAETEERKSEVIAAKEVAGGEWVEISTKYKAPETALDITLSITTDSTSDFIFDDVTITEKRAIGENTVSAAGNRVLKDIYANYFRVGSVLNSGTVNNSSITAMIIREFNSITCENEMKPDATLVQSGSTNTNIRVSLNRAASILNFCARNNIAVRGHAFVWHSQTPQWFFKDNFQDNGNWVSASVMDQRMESYIKNMFAEIQRQYPSLNLYAYDVVNEAVSDDSNRTRNYGGAREPGYGNGRSPWVQIYGDNKFIEKAFTYARKYAPANCKLYYNDYNEYWDHKRDCIASICTSLYNKGLLDGVGMQSHINSDMNGFSGIQNYKAALQKYINIGCDVQITELDISTENGKFSLQQQADKYKAVFQAAVDINKTSNKGKVTAVCVWGPNDANTWIGSENAPLLFDRNNQPKPAYNSVASIILQSEWGDGDNPVGGGGGNPEEPDENGYYYHDTFEGSVGQWTGRGPAEVLTSGRTAYKGSESLLIRDRTAAWNGAQRALNPRTFVPGNKYCFSSVAMFIEGATSTTFCMKLQYVDANGEARYDTIDMKDALPNQWVHLYNPEYRIPADATDMYVYVETADDTINFYIDEAIGAIAGTVIDGPVEPKVKAGDVNLDGSINSTDLTMLRRGVLKLITLSEQSQLAADVDQNGKVNSTDITILSRYLLKMIDKLPYKEVSQQPDENKTPFNYDAALQYRAAPDNYLNTCSQAGRIVKETYTGINGTKSLNVYLPYGYDSNKKYNIFYLMHGGGENENTIFSNDVKLQNILDHMIMNDELEPLIVVTPTFNGGNCTAQNFYQEFRANVIPFVEGKYSTYAESTTPEGIKASRMHRAFGGFSMGGLTTWTVMANCLDYVAYFMPLSGDYWAGNSGQEKANALVASINNFGLSNREYFVLAATGSEDIAYANMVPQIEAMKTKPQFVYTSDFSKGNFYFLVAPGLTHWWGYVRHYIYDALPYFFHE